MSPLGRFLLNLCDNNLRINLNDHSITLERFGNRFRIENYCRQLGLTALGTKHTVMGMAAVKAPERKLTLMGIPAVRIG